MSSASSPLGRKECVVPTFKCCGKVNNCIEHVFQRLGFLVSMCPVIVLLVNVAVLVGLCFGLANFQVEQNIFDLWTPTDSPIWDESEFIDEYWSDKDYGLVVMAAYAKDGFATNIMEPKYFSEWYDIHLKLHTGLPKKNYTYTKSVSVNGSDDETEDEEATLLFGYFMEDYYDPLSLDELSNLSETVAPHYASRVVPLCRNFATSPLEAQFELPCYMLQVLDCFTEGGYMFPYENYLEKSFFENIISPNPYIEKPSFQDMTQTELGAVLAPSCSVWSGTVVPSNYIMGGTERLDDDDDQSQITSISSFETINFVDSPFNIARKIKIAKGECTYTSVYSFQCDTPTTAEKEEAEEFLDEWLADYIDFMEELVKDQANDDSKLLEVVFWTPRTASDLLIEASTADFSLLGFAYGAMIVFAALVAFKPRDLFLSRSEASCVGVLLVLLAVMATMGTGALWLKFSPNVIQVLPFIALGFGVDDMFVLLFAFRFRENLTIKQMMGETVRLAGSSVAMTSVSNFCGFFIGSTMVLPDVARFATFGMIIVVLNFFTVLFGFTAVLALTAKRMAKRHNDWSCCCCFADFTKAKKTKSERHNAAHVFDPFFDFMTNDYTRIFGFLGFWAMVGLGIYGSTMAKLGLPLADIVPDGTYASEFLTVREKFYFSYVVSLYTDGQGKNLQRMNWPEVFGDWIEATEDIYSVSDLIYSDPDVHDFWAWNMRDYLKDAYNDTFEPFELNPMETGTNTSTKSWNCEDDRIGKCPSLFANYTYGSDLYDCLYYNYDLLDADCQGFIDSLVDLNATVNIARQVQVLASSTLGVEGVYLASSQSSANVFTKKDGNGILFQADDMSWVILDENYTASYFAPTTAEDGYPPQYGWMDERGTLQSLSTVYWDENFTEYYRPSDVFIDSDIDVNTEFDFVYDFDANGGNDGGCYLLDAMRASMVDTELYQSLSFSSDLSGSAVVECNATYESTSICSAIAYDDTINSTMCGELVESAERPIDQTTFWVGNCGNNGFTVVGVDGLTNITSSDACGCDGESFSSGNAYNYLSACADDDAWGGFDISASGSETCASSDQEISLTCVADTCSSIDSCIYDFVGLSMNASSSSQCQIGNLEDYLEFNNEYNLVQCLVDHYSELSECCQLGFQADVLLNEAWSCESLQSFSPSATVCSIRETCNQFCESACYYDTNGNCADAIENFCWNQFSENNETGLLYCLLKDTVNSAAFEGQCCYQHINDDDAAWDEHCMIPEGYYWDYDRNPTPVWNITGPNRCSADDISDAGCSAYPANSTDLMDCLIENKENITELSCCRKIVDQSETTFFFTHDCQGDASNALWQSNTWDVSMNVLQAMAGLAFQASFPDSPNALSPTCARSLQYCYADGTWPLTAVGERAEVSCDAGYGGTMTRNCSYYPDTYIPTWGDVDDSNCSRLYCEGGIKNQQYWNRTEVFHARAYYGNVDVTDSKLKCYLTEFNSFTYPYVQRYCNYNESSHEAYWGIVIKGCRAFFGNYEYTQYVDNAYCVEDSASLVEIYDPTDDYTEEQAQVEACESRCSFTDHCVGFLFDNSTRTCKIYDHCEPESYNSLTIPSGVEQKQLTYYWAEYPLNQFGAVYCSAAVAADGGSMPVWAAWGTDGIPDPRCFNMSMYLYFVNPAAGTLYRDKILFNDVSYFYDEAIRLLDLEVVSSYNSFSVKGVDDDEVAVELILSMRDRLDEWEEMGIYVIPGGLVFDLFSQYVGVEESLLINLLWVSIAVMVTGFAFLLNWWAVFICLLCNAAMIVEVYGFVEWLGLRVNGVLVLNIVIAVGLTMEFTAHIGRSYVLTKATRLDHERGVGLPFSTDGQIRMKKMYREMFSPVTMGAITTFLGVLPISLAEFPYFRQYYFVLYVVIVLFGWLNGVIFQPIFLSLLPPEPFDEEPLKDDEEPLTKATQADSQTDTVDGQATTVETLDVTDGDQKTSED